MTFEEWKESVKDLPSSGSTDLDLLQSAYTEGYNIGYFKGYNAAERDIEEENG